MLVFILPILVGLTILTAALGVMRLRSGENKVAKRLRSIRGALWNDEDVETAMSGGKLPFFKMGNLTDGSLLMQASVAFRSEPFN